MADMTLTGRVLDANMAEQVGLVQHLAPKGPSARRAGGLSAKTARMARLTVLRVPHALPRIQAEPHGAASGRVPRARASEQTSPDVVVKAE